MWSQISSNRQKSIFYSLFMAAVLVFVGAAFGMVYLGEEGAVAGGVFAVVIWLILLLISYYSGDQIFLSSSGAKRVTQDDFPMLFNVVEEMKIASGLARMPNIYIIDDPSPNAFATGRGPNKASVAVTSGLLSRLSRDELQGVIAHEMSHVVNRDILLMMVLGVMLGAIVIMADAFFRVRFWGGGGRRSSSKGGGQEQIILLVIALFFMILAPIMARMIYFAVSRRREYLADACGAQFTRYPEGLASALEKISTAPGSVRTANRVTAPMYIVNPLSKVKSAAVGLFSTHPPTEERIRILRGIGGGYSLASYHAEWKKTASDRKGVLFTAEDMKSKIFTQAAAAAPAVSVSEPVASKSSVSDFFWKKEGYRGVECDCGVKIKIPPDFKNNFIHCTKCGKKHAIPQVSR
ncbi:MAG: M48 family metallopeptidase [bacterium]